MKNIVPRIATYPIMGPGGIDYGEGHAYETESSDPERGKSTICVLHRLLGDNLVSQLVHQKKAEFACTIVSPSSAYRRIEKAVGDPQRTDAGGIRIEQQVEIVTDRFAPPVMFQPFVITNTRVDRFVVEESHGLDKLWIGEEISLPRAAMLAVQPFYNAKTLMKSLLRLQKGSDGRLKPGSFEVRTTEGEGFYFLVEVENGLYNGLRNPKSFQHRDSIYAMALVQGLEILHKVYKEPDSWKEHQNLRNLYKMLKDRNLSTWEEEDFKPNQVVAAFHPHEVVQSAGEEYE